MKKNANKEKYRQKNSQHVYKSQYRSRRDSKATYIQTNAEAAERRKRINPRAVLADPEIFLDDPSPRSGDY